MTLDPRPDQQTDPPTAMVAAGGAAGVFKGRLVIVSGTGYSGVFVYSPSPGTGKLKASMSNGGTDPYGNVFNPGVETFDNLGRTVTMANNALTWSKLTDTPDIPPFIAGDPSKANGNSIEISTAEGNVASNPAAITLYDSAAASGVVGALSGFGLITIPQACVLTCDDWQTMPAMSSGWTVGGAASYRLNPDNSVTFAFRDLVPAGTPSDGTTIWANGSLPAAYQPLHNTRLNAYTDVLRQPTGVAEACALEIGTAGNITCFGVANAATRVDMYATMPRTNP